VYQTGLPPLGPAEHDRGTAAAVAPHIARALLASGVPGGRIDGVTGVSNRVARPGRP
jgi:hypothetical protein